MSRVGSTAFDRWLFGAEQLEATLLISDEERVLVTRESWFSFPKLFVATLLFSLPLWVIESKIGLAATNCLWFLFVLVSSAYLWVECGTAGTNSVPNGYIPTRIQGIVGVSIPVVLFVVFSILRNFD